VVARLARELEARRLAAASDEGRAVVRQSGPQGLRAIKSFHDEKLAGKLTHLRSSRLSQQWRVLYYVEVEVVTVYVEKVTPHDYRP